MYPTHLIHTIYRSNVSLHHPFTHTRSHWNRLNMMSFRAFTSAPSAMIIVVVIYCYDLVRTNFVRFIVTNFVRTDHLSSFIFHLRCTAAASKSFASRTGRDCINKFFAKYKHSHSLLSTLFPLSLCSESPCCSLSNDVWMILSSVYFQLSANKCAIFFQLRVYNRTDTLTVTHNVSRPKCSQLARITVSFTIRRKSEAISMDTVESWRSHQFSYWNIVILSISLNLDPAPEIA